MRVMKVTPCTDTPPLSRGDWRWKPGNERQGECCVKETRAPRSALGFWRLLGQRFVDFTLHGVDQLGVETQLFAAVAQAFGHALGQSGHEFGCRHG